MRSPSLIEGALTRSVIGAFYDVYNALGFGFLEHIYVLGMERELRDRGHDVGREVLVNVRYKGEVLGSQRLDMVVDGKLIVETKSTYKLHEAAPRQLYSYLKGTHLEVGLLLHFGPRPTFFRVLSRNRQYPESAQSG
jgi:GxxExxY protein